MPLLLSLQQLLEPLYGAELEELDRALALAQQPTNLFQLEPLAKTEQDDLLLARRELADGLPELICEVAAFQPVQR
jgi:hypothetical protein